MLELAVWDPGEPGEGRGAGGKKRGGGGRGGGGKERRVRRKVVLGLTRHAEHVQLVDVVQGSAGGRQRRVQPQEDEQEGTKNEQGGRGDREKTGEGGRAGT